MGISRMNFAEALLGSSAPSEKVALVTQQGSLSYGELREQARQVGKGLQDRGLLPGERVLLVSESSIFWVVSYLGIALAGGVSVPMAVPVDSAFFSNVHDATEPRFAFVQAKWLRRLGALLDPLDLLVSDLRPPHANSGSSLITLAELTDDLASEPGLTRSDDELAAIMFTSGSTATPRGVMVSHGNILANSEDIVASLDIGPDDRMMAVLPFHYCFGTSLLHTHLLAGASLVIDNRFLFPEKVLQNMVDSQCTSLAGVPSTYQILLRRSNLKNMDFPHLVKLQQAGGKLAQPFIDELEECLPRARLYVMYGQTEATARLSCISPEERRAHPGSIGFGLNRVSLKVRGESGEPVSPGEVGEIIASGPNITLGYWKNKAATERVFSNGLHTGDLAKVDEDGYIIIVDRARDFLKCGGKRVSCKQIEETMAHFPGVSEAAVVGIADLVLGEAVCLFVVHPKGSNIEGDLQQFCKKELEPTLLPKQIIYLDSLPKNKSGKLDKLALKKMLPGRN